MADKPNADDVDADDLDAVERRIAARRPEGQALPADAERDPLADAALAIEEFAASGPRLDVDAIWDKVEPGIERTRQRGWAGWGPPLPAFAAVVPRVASAVAAAVLIGVAVSAVLLLIPKDDASAEFFRDVKDLARLTDAIVLDAQISAAERAEVHERAGALAAALDDDGGVLSELALDDLKSVAATLAEVQGSLASVPGVEGTEREAEAEPETGTKPDTPPAADPGESASVTAAPTLSDSLGASLETLGSVVNSVEEAYVEELVEIVAQSCSEVTSRDALEACQDTLDDLEEAVEAQLNSADSGAAGEAGSTAPLPLVGELCSGISSEEELGACEEAIDDVEKGAKAEYHALREACDELDDEEAEEACEEALDGAGVQSEDDGEDGD